MNDTIVMNILDSLLKIVKILDDRITILEEKNPKQYNETVNRQNLKIDLIKELKQVIEKRGIQT